MHEGDRGKEVTELKKEATLCEEPHGEVELAQKKMTKMTKSNSNVHASTVHIRTNLLREVINKLSVDETGNAVTDNFLASRSEVVRER